MFADSRYANIEKKCRYGDVADADINIGTPLIPISLFARVARALYFYQNYFHYIVTCQRGGVSNEPSLLDKTWGQGSFGPLTAGLNLPSTGEPPIVCPTKYQEITDIGVEANAVGPYICDP